MKQTSQSIEAEIVERLGFVPPFFLSARPDPHVFGELWHHTLSAYLDNPLPALFKEKLTAILSRHCAVPYCLMCHSASMRPLGMRGGDLLQLLKAKNPFLAAAPVQAPADGLPWTHPASWLETWVLACSEAIFLHIDWERAQASLLDTVGDLAFNRILTLISYVRACLDWISAHPTVRHQDDMRVKLHMAPLMAEEPGLALFFAEHGGPSKDLAVRWMNQDNQQLLQELQKSNRALKEREAELTGAISALESQKALRERFVSALSHDLRAPIAVGLMSSQLIARKGAADATYVLRVCKRIEASMTRADRMIRDLLDANRIEAGKKISLVFEPTQMDALLANATADLNQIHSDCVVFRNKAGVVQGTWDAGALRRVVDNLVANAVKYGKRNAAVTLTLNQLKEGVELQVHNQGQAIAPQDQERLFAPYARTQSAIESGQQGWGIGLAVVKEIAVLHGGRVGVDSSEANGTTFSIKLPMDSARASGSRS